VINLKICLVDADSKIPNLALMKIAAYHWGIGDSVKFYNPGVDKPDLIYSSKIFKSSPDYAFYPADVPLILGGTSYDIKAELPAVVEAQCPDYTLYRCDYALGFTSRGCSRNCAFCLVPEKEGLIRPVGDIYDFWRCQKEIMLLDNNLTADPEHFELICGQLAKEQIKTDFCQGLDIRFMTADMAKMLSKVKVWKQFRFAWDDIKDEDAVTRGIDILVKNGVARWKQMFYVLIGFNTTEEEDLYRIEKLRSLKVDPFVMPYDKSIKYQQQFARYVNHKATFKSCSWGEYTG